MKKTTIITNWNSSPWTKFKTIFIGCCRGLSICRAGNKNLKNFREYSKSLGKILLSKKSKFYVFFLSLIDFLLFLLNSEQTVSWRFFESSLLWTQCFIYSLPSFLWDFSKEMWNSMFTLIIQKHNGDSSNLKPQNQSTIIFLLKCDANDN